MSNSQPIGVFDSGVGGLTVVKALRDRLPNETIVYLGDTARVPYGPKSPETVQRYTFELAQMLMQKNAKAIVVACNTVSSVALPLLTRKFSVPVIGVIEPGAGAPLHAHDGVDEIFIVLEGTLDMRLGDERFRVEANHTIAIPAGVLHAFVAAGPTPVRMFTFMPRNRAIADVFEPGSTMKMFIAAAALEEQLITPTTMLYGENGHMTVANTVIHDHEKMGWMTFSEVIQKSSNIGAAKVAMRLGEHRTYDYLRRFGFGERTDVDLPGEVAGLLKSPREWGRRTLASIAMGQEIGVTGLQMASAVSAIANGGVLMKPYVVAEVRDTKGRLLAEMGPQQRRQVISQETARTLSEMLEKVVANGTGTKAAVSGIRVAGKTGTAQKVDPRTGAYSSILVVGSFVGFLPADDPKIVIAVMVDEPQVDAWGGAVAAPAFRRIAEQVLPYLGVTPNSAVNLAMVVE